MDVVSAPRDARFTQADQRLLTFEIAWMPSTPCPSRAVVEVTELAEDLLSMPDACRAPAAVAW